MDDATRDAYLRRLGLELEPPSADALIRLHRAQVERVPYETLSIHLGETSPIDTAASATRIATTTRGGYCFHLNGAFSELLRALGYDVVRHRGGVHARGLPEDEELDNHLVLTVRCLGSDEHPEGTWYVDVGLGDALHEPVPLVAGPLHQGPFAMSLEATPGGVGDWHLTHDPIGGFGGMSWRLAAAEMPEFATKNKWLSTSPDSGFVRFLLVQTRDAKGVTALRGLTLRRIGDGASESTLTTKAELRDVLGDLFAIDLASIDDGAFNRLWDRTHAAHVAWDAAGRP